MSVLRALPWIAGLLSVREVSASNITDDRLRRAEALAVVSARRLQSGNDTGVLDRRLQRRSGNDTGTVETRVLRRSASDTEPRRRASAKYTYEYVGCYRDNGERDFKHGPYYTGYSNSGSGDTGRSYTQASCMDACVRHGGYTYFALQDGDPSYGHHLGGGQCFCDNSYGTPSSTYKQLSDSECGPDGYGRGHANSVYSIHTSEDTGYTFVGCYKDDASRDLDYGPSKETWGLKGFDHESCLAACSGYKYFALQSHGECFCDNSHGTPSSTYYELDVKKCGGTLGLGGSYANAVYRISPSTSYTLYANKNAYNGNGAVDIGTSVAPLTVNQCKAHCDADSACECVTYRPDQQTCWKRRDCVPASFASGSNLFDVYVRDSGCINTEFVMHTDRWPREMSWEISQNGATICSGGGYTSRNKQQAMQTCCIPMGRYKLTCKDSYGDGWGAGKLMIDGISYCSRFAHGEEREISLYTAYTYVGCYEDQSQRDFRYGPYHDGDTSRSYTRYTCRAACTGYRYFALQDGSPSNPNHRGGGQCFCDNSYGTPSSIHSKLPDSRCGGPSEMGRGWANSVYLIQGFVRKFDFFPYKDSHGEDIGQFRGGIEAYAQKCFRNANCKGFNSNGWLKHTVRPKETWRRWTDDPSKGFYVKKA